MTLQLAITPQTILTRVGEQEQARSSSPPEQKRWHPQRRPPLQRHAIQRPHRGSVMLRRPPMAQRIGGQCSRSEMERRGCPFQFEVGGSELQRESHFREPYRHRPMPQHAIALRATCRRCRRSTPAQLLPNLSPHPRLRLPHSPQQRHEQQRLLQYYCRLSILALLPLRYRPC